MKYDFFVASRWRNKAEALHLVLKLKALGKKVYSFADSDTSILDVHADVEEEMKTFEAIGDWQNDATVKKIFNKDLLGLRESREFIMLLPSGKSAHIEAGIAYGLGKKCVLIGEQKETESLYLIFSKYFPNIDAFITSL